MNEWGRCFLESLLAHAHQEHSPRAAIFSFSRRLSDIGRRPAQTLAAERAAAAATAAAVTASSASSASSADQALADLRAQLETAHRAECERVRVEAAQVRARVCAPRRCVAGGE